jgi:hypothetical protein
MSGLNAGTFLKRLEGTITGFGFKREIAGLGINQLRLADGAPLLSGSGNPNYASLETSYEGVVLPSSQTALGTLTFKIPRDYDKSNDELLIRFLANSAGDTNTPTIDATMYRKRAGAALSSDLDPTISDAVNSNTDIADWVEIDASDLGMEAGDAVTLIFASSAHTTDALNVYEIEVIYRSDLVYNEGDER